MSSDEDVILSRGAHGFITLPSIGAERCLLPAALISITTHQSHIPPPVQNMPIKTRFINRRGRSSLFAVDNRCVFLAPRTPDLSILALRGPYIPSLFDR